MRQKSVHIASENIDKLSSINYLIDGLEEAILSKNKRIVVFCIGTDKVTGDSLGPFVGTMLSESPLNKENVKIMGTLEDPIHAVNLVKRVKDLRSDDFVIAIDASLGDTEDIGSVSLYSGPISPGRGVGKKLPSVGDISIIGISGEAEGWGPVSLHHVRLGMVYKQARVITRALYKALSTTPTKKGLGKAIDALV